MAATALPAEVACRRGGAEDAAFMVELAAETFADLGDYRTIIRQWLGEATVSSAIAVCGQERQGFSLVARHWSIGFRNRVTAELVAIAVIAGSRAQGIGRLLLREAEAIARDWGAAEMRLHTAQGNLIAQEFFARAGYLPRKVATTYYPNGEPALALHRRLR